MMRKTTLAATIIALGCNGLEPGSAPDDAIEVTQQKFEYSESPWGRGTPVRAMLGQIPGHGHRLVFQRIDTGACNWRDVGTDGLREHVWIGLSDGNDVGIIASAWGSTMICDGTIYTLHTPNYYTWRDGTLLNRWVQISGLGGNDTLHCEGRGSCDGGDGDDTLIAWGGLPPGIGADSPGLSLRGFGGRDKLFVYGDYPVMLYGGTGQDCLAATHSSSVLAYNCADDDSTSDPEFDASATWIGPWCNWITTNFCSTW
jgi:hypothetical protein